MNEANERVNNGDTDVSSTHTHRPHHSNKMQRKKTQEQQRIHIIMKWEKFTMRKLLEYYTIMAGFIHLVCVCVFFLLSGVAVVSTFSLAVRLCVVRIAQCFYSFSNKILSSLCYIIPGLLM